MIAWRRREFRWWEHLLLQTTRRELAEKHAKASKVNKMSVPASAMIDFVLQENVDMRAETFALESEVDVRLRFWQGGGGCGGGGGGGGGLRGDE